MEDAYIIKGGKPMKGEVTLAGAKNAALKVLIASLLFKGTVTIKHIPNISDIRELIHLLELLGAEVSFKDNVITINGDTMKQNKVDLLHASKIRASFLLFAPLLYKCGEVYIPNPGGCRLGARSIDRVIDGLKALGIEVTYESETGYYHAVMKEKPHGEFTFQKPSHTGTELMIMMSVFGSGIITIHNAAQEPEIDDLINFLNAAGARIKRDGNIISIEGVTELNQTEPYTIASDRVEAATYVALALATQGEVTISSIPDHYIQTFIDTMERIGAGVEKKEEGVWLFYYKPLQSITIETAPHPGFLTDWQPVFAVLMTQASGESIIHERIFENRFSYVEELRRLGAQIEYIDYTIDDPQAHYHFNYDPKKTYQQTIKITGPQKLHGGVMTVSDLRAGATLAIAALIANGDSYVKGISHLERGYENFVEKVRGLGGEIRKI